MAYFNSGKYDWLTPWRYIDPSSKDLIYHSTQGHALFQSQTTERVYITLAKIVFSSNKISRSFAQTAKIDILNALAFLIDAGKISNVEVEVEQYPGEVLINVSYYNHELNNIELVPFKPDASL